MAENEHGRTERQQDAFTFIGLVTTYQQIAWVAMGKVADPATGKVERELEQARWAIDVLAMLERRTRGNLSDGEFRMLRETLHTLRMNYVEETDRPPEPSRKEETAESSEGGSASRKAGAAEERAEPGSGQPAPESKSEDG